MSHSNISIFVAHIGCPCRCSFCNQNSITGNYNKPNATTVKEAVNIAQKSKNYSPNNTEIAFFGGSFTAINRTYMLELLTAAYEFVKQKKVKGIRISTRPDAIDPEVLTILKSYGVTAIELGAQSMCDSVLKLNNRGHSSSEVVYASKLIKSFGFELGLQMMTGLYGSSPEKDIFTAEKIIEIKPQTVRIYPTIILKGTQLADMYNNKKYETYTLETTVSLCAELLNKFLNNNISVIRLGLHTIDLNDYVSGPWHPALKELVENEIYFKEALKKLKNKGNYILEVNENCLSKMIGQNKRNIEKLKKLGYNCIVKKNQDVPCYKVYVQES